LTLFPRKREEGLFLRRAHRGDCGDGELVGALVHLVSGVRFAPDSDRGADVPGGPKSAINGREQV
jgi:hypothetical protein